MNGIVIVSTILLMATFSGCGPRTAYDSLRFSQELECQKMHGDDRDECFKQSGMSYDEYQRHLKERKQDE